MLGRAPSSVYRAIERIEKDIGDRLLTRTPRGRVPTDAGNEVLQLGRQIEAQILEIELRLLGRKAHSPLPVRLSASDGFAHSYLGPLLADFVHREPAVPIELIADNQLADLSRREADIAVRPDQLPGNDLVGRRAGKLSHALYASKALLKRSGTPRDISELVQLPICRLTSDLQHFTSASWWSRVSAGTALRTSMTANSETGLAAAVASGAGVAVLPCFIGDPLEGAQRLPGFPIGDPVDIWLVTHRALRTNRAVMSLMRYLAAAIRRDGALFTGAIERGAGRRTTSPIGPQR